MPQRSPRSPENPFATTNPIGGSVITLVDAHSRALAEQLRQIGLYRGQEMLLKVVATTGGCSQNELVNRLCLDHSSVTKSVGRMEKAGLLTREKDAADRRVTVVKITPDGRQRLTQAEAIWTAIEAQATQGLSTDDTQTFLTLAAKITTNLTQNN